MMPTLIKGLSPQKSLNEKNDVNRKARVGLIPIYVGKAAAARVSPVSLTERNTQSQHGASASVRGQLDTTTQFFGSGSNAHQTVAVSSRRGIQPFAVVP